MKTERFEMRLDRQTLRRVDRWRSQQPDMPSRAEAVRRLMDRSLTASGSSEVEVSDGEKLVLLMLRDICRHQEIPSELDCEFISNAIVNGHFWGIEWEYPGLFGRRIDTPAIVSEVVDVLDMWTFVESGYAKLSDDDKTRIESDAKPFGSLVRFSGFDGNNETEHRSIALFLIRDLKRFQVFKKRDLNSHCPIIDRYRRMLDVFEPMRPTLIGRELSATEIIELLRANTNPALRNNQ